VTQALTLPHATHAGKLSLGRVEIPCFVLSDKTRVLSRRGFVEALRIPYGGPQLNRLVRLYEKPRGPNTLEPRLAAPLRFRVPPQKVIAHGYEGSMLAKLCAMVMAAYREDRIKPEHVHVAKRCLVLAEGFVAIGITALIDEAISDQEERERDSSSSQGQDEPSKFDTVDT
jgi:hypothetical protein